MNTDEAKTEAAIIAARNDAFRQSLENCTVTRGIASLKAITIQDICYAVQQYENYTADNDPYGEHDFGAFIIDGQEFFWKIDYFDATETFGLDPLDEDCARHLTIMLAEEY